MGPRGDLLSGKDGQLERCAEGKKQGERQRGRERGEREKETERKKLGAEPPREAIGTRGHG